MATNITDIKKRVTFNNKRLEYGGDITDSTSCKFNVLVDKGGSGENQITEDNSNDATITIGQVFSRHESWLRKLVERQKKTGASYPLSITTVINGETNTRSYDTVIEKCADKIGDASDLSLKIIKQYPDNTMENKYKPAE